MGTSEVPIRHKDPSQEAGALRSVAEQVSKILTPGEEILYVALQNAMAVTIRPDAAVATTNRFILYRPHLLGRVHFDDFHWQDVKNVRMNQGVLSTVMTVELLDGRTSSLGELDKDQAKRLYSFCQQYEQEWREKRRVREMEEQRARSGGIYMPPPQGAAPAAAAGTGAAGTAGEDSVSKLARAKQMLDQKLISEAEYETLKAKIISEF